MAAIEPFRIAVPDTELDRLRDRIAATRWPDELPSVGWSYGTTVDYTMELARYWRDGFDWRAIEAGLNRFPQFVTTIDRQPIHFMHIRSAHPDAVPLLLTHGWPSTFADFTAMIAPLTDPSAHDGDPDDAFHLVIPSIPGFGFSGPTREPGWGVHRVAEAWAELMRRLGYPRYGVHGGDFGALISPQVARIDSEHVIGVHVNGMMTSPPTDLDPSTLTEAETVRMERLQRWHRELSGYAMVQSTRPQSLAFALTDSPVGQLAWYGDWFAGHGDKVGVLPRDAILTDVTIHWLTGTAGSAARMYRESGAAWAPSPSSGVSTGVAVFAGDSSIRRFAESAHRITAWTEYDTGGHFAAIETPELLAADLARFFRQVR